MENIKIGVQIDANTKEATADAKKYHDQLKQAAETAKSIRVGGGQAAPTAAPSYKAAKQPTGAVTQGQPVGSQEVMEYGSLRGTAAATGASARDFAKQSEGLSGLVRLYAVFAANTYALTAAFGALSRAMDTTNMIKGLDQLGATSGRNLQGLALQFQNVAGGAVNMREAMEAVVKTTASGLGSTDVIRLGAAAQKASAALGVNMSDAVSRLSRGITKLEPELLDELGLFTKIDPAVEAYSRSVGKAATQLTDFERRQAFATAVLKEAEQKFGSLEIDVNPFTKLAATFQNLLQTTLELVNKGLTPIVNLLNSNPVLLAAAVTAFASSLLKTVMPQLKNVKEGLADLAKSRESAAIGKRSEAVTALLPSIVTARESIDKQNDAYYTQFEQSRQKLKEKLQKLGPISPQFLTTLEKLPGDLTSKDIEALKSQFKGRSSWAVEARADLNEYSKAAAGAAKTDNELVALQTKLKETVNERRGVITGLGNIQRDADAAYNAGVRANIISDAARKTSLLGVIGAFKSLKENLKEASKDTQFAQTLEGTTASGKKFTQEVKFMQRGLSGLPLIFTAVSGAATIAATSIAGIGMAIMRFLPYLGLVVAAFEGLKFFLFDSKKQSESFSQSSDLVTSSLEGINKTIDAIAKKDPSKVFSVATIEAYTNSLTDLNSSFTDLLQKSEDLSRVQTSWERGWDRLKEIVIPVEIQTRIPVSARQELGNQIAGTIKQSLKVAQGLGRGNELAKEYEKILGFNVANISEEELATRLKINNSFEQLNKLGKDLNTSFTDFTRKATQSTGEIKAFVDGIAQTTKEVDSLLANLAPTDPFGKIGIGLINNANDLARVLGSTEDTLLALQEISGNIKITSLLPAETAAKLAAFKLEAEATTTEIGRQDKALIQFNKELDTTRQKYEKLKQSTEGTFGVRTEARLKAVEATKTELDQANRRVNETEARIATLKTQNADFLRSLAKETEDALVKSAEKQLEISSKFARERASLELKRTRLSIAQEAGVATAEDRAKINQDFITIEEKLVTANLQLALSIEAARVSQDKVSVSLRMLIEQLKLQAPNLSQAEMDAINAKITNFQKDLIGLEIAGKRLEGTSVKDAEKLIDQLISSGTEVAENAKKAFKDNNLSANVMLKLSPEEVAGARAEIKKSIESTVRRSEVLRAGARQNLEALAQNRVNTALKDQNDILKESYDLKQKIIDSDIKNLNNSLEQLRVVEDLFGIYVNTLANKKQSIEIDIATKTSEKEILEFRKQLEQIELSARSRTPKGQQVEYTEKEIDRKIKLDAEIVRVEQNTANKITGITIRGIKTRLAEESRLFDEEQNFSKQRFDIQKSLDDIKTSSIEREISLLDSLDIRDKTILNNLKLEIELRKINNERIKEEFDIQQRQDKLNADKQRLKTLQDQARSLQNQQNQQTPGIGELGVNTEQLPDVVNANLAATQLQNRITQEQQIIDARRQQLMLSTEERIASATQTAEVANRQESYNQQLERTKNLAETIGSALAGWGESTKRFGTGLASVVEVFGQLEDSSRRTQDALDELVEKRKQALERDVEDDDPVGALATKKAKDIMGFDKAIAAQRQKQTRDEISGYAKLAGAAKSMFKEKSAGAKAFGALEKALHIARLAMDIKELILSVSTGKSKMAQNLAEMFVVGKKAVLEAYAAPFPVGFATGAMMAAIVAAIIGKAVGGGGKASFVPTAATRQETQGTAFAYNETGEKVQVRSGVFGNESEKTESIKNSLQILRDNSINGLKYDDRLLKSFEKLNRSILEIARSVYTRASNLRTGRISGIPEGTVKDTTKVPGAIGAVAGSIAGYAIGATIGGTITGGTLATIAGAALGPVGLILGAVLGKVLGGLFGKKVTQTVTDSGIRLTGTINDLTNRVEGAVQGFATVQITKKSFFSGTDVSSREVPVDVAKEITVAVSDAIGAGAQTILELADILGVERQKILTLFETLKVDGEVGKISFKGKSLEEINQEFGAVIGGILSDLAEKSFSPLIQVFRQAGEDALQTATRLAVNKRSVEQIFANLTDGTIRDLSIQTTESLLEISGGLDKFAESASKYAENFLTEEERLAPTRKAVNAELDRLGLSSIKTRAQFKAAIDFLIKNDLTASETFTSLMNVSEGFAAVTESTEKTQDALKKAYDTRVQELTKAKTDFEGFAKSIRDFTLSLKTGALSPLTPQQQYDQLKAEFLSISALAQTGDVTAIGKLQGISQSFLDASKKMFASSAEYITDFNTVLDANESTATFAELQVKVATDTLDQIKLSVEGLITIDQTLQTLPVALTGLGDNLTKALADYTAVSDSNLNGLFEKVTETLVERSNGFAGLYSRTTTTEIEYFKNVIVGSFEEILNRYEERRVAAGIPVSEAEPLPGSVPTAVQTSVINFGNNIYEASQRVLTVSESLDVLDRAIKRRLETVTTPTPTPTNPLSLAGAIPDIPSGALWFARGGVVEGMTPFRYNEGVGVMGEAGPEAIMPLHRMPNGDLGVMSAGNDVLAKQLAELNKQVQQLTQVVADGAIMNAQATERNTEQITQAVTDTVESSNYQAKLTNRTRVV